MTITNVFLLNFLISVIDAIYGYMQRGGEFYAKKYRYYFYLSVKNATEASPNDLETLILHPAPYTLITGFLIFLLPFK